MTLNATFLKKVGYAERARSAHVYGIRDDCFSEAKLYAWVFFSTNARNMTANINVSVWAKYFEMRGSSTHLEKNVELRLKVSLKIGPMLSLEPDFFSYTNFFVRSVKII